MTLSSNPEFSAAWDRRTLLDTPTYIASSRFISHVQWLKIGNQNNLVIAKTPDDPKDMAHMEATCAVIGTVSRNRLFSEPHGNYNPNFEKTALETSKAIKYGYVRKSGTDRRTDTDTEDGGVHGG